MGLCTINNTASVAASAVAVRDSTGALRDLRGSTYTFWTGFFRFLAAYSAVLGSMSPSGRTEPRGEWR